MVKCEINGGRLKPAAGGIVSLQQGDTLQLEDCDARSQLELQWESDSRGIRRHTPSCLMLMAYRYRRCVCAPRLISLEEPKIIQLILQPPPSAGVSTFLYLCIYLCERLWVKLHTQLLCRMCGFFKTVVKCDGVTPGTYRSVNADVLTEVFCLTWRSELGDFLHLSPLTSLFPGSYVLHLITSFLLLCLCFFLEET